MFRIIVLNPKGGCGKTTLSVNLASHFSQQGKVTTLMDLDPQGSSVFWAHRRPGDHPEIQLVDAHNCSASVTRSWAIQPPKNTEVLVIDTPARPNLHIINPLLVDASAIIIPVQPSEFDIHTAANFITQLGCSLPDQRNIAIVANRAKKNSAAHKKLLHFFAGQNMEVVASLRDTQNFGAANAQGLGITEIMKSSFSQDRNSFLALAQWCEERISEQMSGQLAKRKTLPPDYYIALSSIA